VNGARQEPEGPLGAELAHVAAYLDFYRSTLAEKCRSLPVAELRVARVPSGWTPLELLDHVAHMEQRWFVWGFLGEPLTDPWGDSSGAPERPWHVPADRDLDQVVAFLEEQAARTHAVLARHGPEDVAARTGRFAGEPQPPTLRWTCFHVLQEYARHAGHLDVAVELAGGHTGE
jgi:uncharacterized damage-inducible protein DinB